MKTIDACGISCPEPLIMLKSALKTEKEITMLVDSKNALANCVDFAEKNGFSVNTTEEADKFRILIAVK